MALDTYGPGPANPYGKFCTRVTRLSDGSHVTDIIFQPHVSTDQAVDVAGCEFDTQVAGTRTYAAAPENLDLEPTA